jgi:formyl-CoA transferase
MSAMGRDDLAADPALATNAGRAARASELDAAIEAWTRERTLDDALEALERAEVPASRVYDAEDILNDAHYAARGVIERWTLPDGTDMKIPGIVPKLTETPGATRWLGPVLGEHTAEVLERLGYSAADQQSLRQRGVI